MYLHTHTHTHLLCTYTHRRIHHTIFTYLIKYSLYPESALPHIHGASASRTVQHTHTHTHTHMYTHTTHTHTPSLSLSHTSAESLVFLGYHVPGPLSKSLVWTLKQIIWIRWRWGNWGNWTEFHMIKYRIKFCNYVYQCQGYFCKCTVYASFKHTFSFLEFFVYFGTFCFFCLKFCNYVYQCQGCFCKFTVYASFKHTFSIAMLMNFSFLEFFVYFGTFCFFCLPFLPSYWGTRKP